MKMKKVIAALTAAVTIASSLCMGVGAAKSDNSLVVAIDADIATLHATDMSTTVEVTVLNQNYDTLMYMNPDGTKEPEPRIAESYEISEDGLDYTFKIRKDATFHDGTPITVDDVVFSIELYKASEYQGSQISMLSSVEAIDDETVVCHLDVPYAPFLSGICAPNIASKAYYEADAEKFAAEPIGSGPYKFVSREIGSQITLEAYEDYYRGKANIEKVTFKVVPDPATMAIALQTGGEYGIDFAEVTAAVLPQLEATPTVEVAEVETSAFVYVSMNLEKEPYNDVLVRQAINYAIDRENLVNVCFEGKASVNSSLCAPSRFGYSEDLMQYSYDPEKAKELLAEAGITAPYDLGTMIVAEQYANLAAVIQNDLKAVGLEVTIEPQEFNTFIGGLTSGNYGITVLQMALEGDTQQLEMAFITDYIGMANNARYSDETMNGLFEQTKTETDTEARAELFNQILTKAQEEAIYASLCNPLMLFAYNADLEVSEFAFEGNYFIYDFAWAE